MPEQSPPASPSHRRLDRTWFICLALLVLFALETFLATRTKSPTYDEPLHAAAAWKALREGDFRVNTEDPILWKYWAALPTWFTPLNTQPTDSLLESVQNNAGLQWPFTVAFLYRTPANVPLLETFFARQRLMMLLVAIALGVTIAWWARALGGKVAAITATTLFALDPNFLAHASLVKNDVSLSLVMLALAITVWRVGQRITLANVAAMTLLCAAAVTTKYSGVLLGPIVAILLIVRALSRTPWIGRHDVIELRSRKLATSAILLSLCVIISFAGIWVLYRLRFPPTSAPKQMLNLTELGKYAADAEIRQINRGGDPTDEQVANWKPGLMMRTVFYLNFWGVLPQAWIHGLLYTYQSALTRDTFLLGRHSKVGWWYYFPLAMLFKTPMATLGAIAGALALGVVIVRQRALALVNWTAICLFVPPAFYLLAAVTSNLNLGLRHVLPVYPFLFIAVGLAAAEVWRRWRRAAIWTGAFLALMLAIESFNAFPNYIPFFNVADGGSRGGLKLLGDSNLDWGQDLKLLAEWQKKHPGEPLYLVYFGLADPWAYKIDYINFPGGYDYGPEVQATREPGVLAISATCLQGIYGDGVLRDTYGKLQQYEPIEVLGGSIYLYRWPPQK